MTQANQNRKFKHPPKKIASVNYCIKPKTVINTPLNKYDLTQLQSDIDNQQITDHFNYGFNSQTFSSYAKLSKRFAQIQEIEHSNHQYDSKKNNQFRFNDDMPIDLGGFGPFLDEQLVNLWEDKDIDLANSLMDYFVKFNICLAFNKNNNQPSLSSFISLMNQSDQNQDYSLSNLVDLLAEKINDKYQRTLSILRQRQVKNKDVQLQDKPSEGSQGNFYESIFNKKKTKSEESQRRKKKEDNKQTFSQNQDKLKQDSIRYSSISQSQEDKDQQKSNPKHSQKSKSKKHFSKNPKQDSDQQKKHQREKSSQKKDKKKKIYHDKREKKSQKSKKKSKKIKKHKTNKKHKKHGKKSKKHKK